MTDDRKLTTRQGHPVFDNQNLRTVGDRGPATLENYVADDELGERVGDGLGIGLDEVKGLQPLATQTLSEAELQRAANLGHNGPCDVTGLEMTHCVPNEHAAVTEDAELVAGD